jgi:hypothetical protein
VVIEASDKNWEIELSAAFAKRVRIELKGLEKLRLSSAEFYRLVANWSVHWNYTPKLVDEFTVHLVPDMIPPSSVGAFATRPHLAPGVCDRLRQ